MITTIRLPPLLKNRINACLKIFSSPKNSSDIIRLALERGAESMLEELEKNTKQSQTFDIRHLAQHYDFQEEFSAQQLAALFDLLYSDFSQAKACFYIHPSTLHNLIDLFLEVIENRHLKIEAFTELKSHYWLETYLSQDGNIKFYDFLTKAALGLREIKQQWEKLSFIKEREGFFKPLSILKSIAEIMKVVLSNPQKYLVNFRTFQKAIYPYLKTVIIVAKSKLAKDGNKVCHYLNGPSFCFQHNIKEMTSYQSEQGKMACNITLSDDRGPHFSAVLSFDRKKSVSMMMSFDEFNDLIKFAALFHDSIDTLEGPYLIEGRELKFALFVPDKTSEYRGSITIRNTPIYFSKEEFKDLFSFFHHQIVKDLSSQIEALQYQFGRI